MKTLFLSLLRLGDLLLHLEVIKAYSKQNPQEKIYILINEEFAEVKSLLPERVTLLYFPRGHLQKQIVDRSYHFRHAYESVESLIQSWNQNDFTKVINLTHNRSSAFLSGMIQAEKKIGLRFDQVFQGQDENRWWSYLNHQFATQFKSDFSYIQILKSAVNVKEVKRVLIHPFSNDKKKNWKMQSFLDLARQIASFANVGSVVFVGTEKDLAQHPGIAAEFSTCVVSFSQLREELLWSDGLIAVDSSVKHLAASIGKSVLEVAVGSASPSKYSSSEKVTVVAAKAPCFPCSYSKSCSYEVPICHEEITVQDLLAQSIKVFGLKQTVENPNGKYPELSA